MNHCLSQVDVLRQVIADKKLLAFADDVLIRSSDLENASKIIRGFENLA
jgi:hypothetical protein